MENPSFIFTTPFNVNVVQVKGQEQVYLEGFISTTDKDLGNDIVTKNCLESMQQQILERNIKLDLEHESFRGESAEEKEINKTLVPAGKITDATVQPTESGFGLAVKSVLNRFRKDFEKLKGNVIERFLDSYSIAYIPTRVAHKEVNGEEVRLLDDVKLLNVALTGNPMNTAAQNREIFIKSMDAVEEYIAQKKENPDVELQLEVKHTNNQKEVKEMGEENSEPKKTESTTEIEAEKPTEKPAEEKPAEESTEGTEAKELKALNERMDKLEKENAELKALLNKPVHKSLADPQKKDAPEAKEVNPLDAIV